MLLVLCCSLEVRISPCMNFLDSLCQCDCLCLLSIFHCYGLQGSLACCFIFLESSMTAGFETGAICMGVTSLNTFSNVQYADNENLTWNMEYLIWGIHKWHVVMS